MHSSETEPNLHDAKLGKAATDAGLFTPANDNFVLEERQITNNRERALILLALYRHLEDIFPQSVETVEIWALPRCSCRCACGCDRRS
jgi:hypothetical protein